MCVCVCVCACMPVGSVGVCMQACVQSMGVYACTNVVLCMFVCAVWIWARAELIFGSYIILEISSCD